MSVKHRQPSRWRRWRESRTRSWSVKIHHSDGRVTECPVVQDPRPPSGDIRKYWQAVIPPGTVFSPGDQLHIARLVPGAALDTGGVPLVRLQHFGSHR